MISLRSSLLSAAAALSVFAATTQPAAALVSTYSSNGEVYKVVEYVSSDAENIRVSTVLKGPGPRDTYAARTVPIKQSRFASWYKPRLGSLVKANLWWMGFVATIEAAGWAIDELQGQVVQVNRIGTPGVYYWLAYNGNSGFAVGSTKEAACNTLGEMSGASYYSLRNGDTQCYMIVGTAGITQGVQQRDCSQPLGDSASLPTCTGIYPTSPVSDADLQAAINAQLAADPAHAATAFTDPATGRGYADLFDPVPYIPGLSASDEALVNCYIGGQLQMVNSDAACYVATQAEYDRVKQQAEALAAGRTPEGEADALNSELKQPITQAQFEESNKKFSDAVADVTADVNAKNNSDYPDIGDKFEELDGIITDLPNTSLPAPADISVPQYVDCQQLTLSDGNGHELVFPSPAQCVKIETFKQGFGYFLAVSVVFLLCMQLLTRPHG